MKRIFQLFTLTILLFAVQNAFGQKVEVKKILPLGNLNTKAKILPMPVLPNIQPRIGGSVNVLVKVDLQKGEVVEAQAVSGHPLLRKSAENAALQAKFEPILQEFKTSYGLGTLVYKIEDFTGKIVENKKPKPIIAKIKSGIVTGAAKILPKPIYSEEMQNSCAFGKVEVEVLSYMPTGEVFLAKAVSGDEILRKSAEEAAMKAVFSTPIIDGDINVYIKGKLVYNFEPSKKCVNGKLTDWSKYRLVSDLKLKVISMPKPEFPNGGKNVSGTVSVIVTIDEEGNVINAESVSGHPLLRPFAEKAAMKAKFEPYSLGGKPAKVRFPIAYEFKREESQELVIKKTPKLPIVNGMARVLPKPEYPQEAKDLCVGGKVEIEVLIDSERGDVLQAKAISGDELLRSVSVETSKKAKFNPLLDMTPIKLKGIIVYNFPVEKNCLNARIVNTKAIKIPIPQLPHSKITKETEVKVLVVIDENGNVISARSQTNVHPLLRVAFEKAAREAKFNPIWDVGKIKIKGFIVYKIKPNGKIEI